MSVLDQWWFLFFLLFVGFSSHFCISWHVTVTKTFQFYSLRLIYATCSSISVLSQKLCAALPIISLCVFCVAMRIYAMRPLGGSVVRQTTGIHVAGPGNLYMLVISYLLAEALFETFRHFKCLCSVIFVDFSDYHDFQWYFSRCCVWVRNRKLSENVLKRTKWTQVTFERLGPYAYPA